MEEESVTEYGVYSRHRSLDNHLETQQDMSHGSIPNYLMVEEISELETAISLTCSY
jgi:hypothetical protein